jgi:hypothetical protein
VLAAGHRDPKLGLGELERKSERTKKARRRRSEKGKSVDKTAIYGVSGIETPPSERRVRVSFARQPSRVQIGKEV